MDKSCPDQTGYDFTLDHTFTDELSDRVISLVPSQTELLWALGLNEQVVGITKFCVHPQAWFKSKERVGGTKTVDFEKVKRLNPTLIIANKEENTKQDIEALRALYPVWTSDIFTLEDNLEMIEQVATLCRRQEKGQNLAEKIRINFKTLNKSMTGAYLYIIWKKPIMAAGCNTYIHDMLGRMGLGNVLTGKQGADRYPALTEDIIQNLSPDYVFLSSEPYPFKEKHIKEFQNMFPGAKIILVDGEIFSWYGYRSLIAPEYFKKLGSCL